ncbi:MAG: fatty acid desaturase family protein [Actinomycetota bacterium]
MSLEIMRDPRIRSVEWKDLLVLNRWEIIKELLLVFPWLITSLVLAHYGHFLFALPFSFIFFLCGLRVVHNAYHYVLGISRPATEWVMYFLSVMMLSAMHALQQTHLHHHKHCLGEDDVEAASALMPGWKAVLYGPRFYYMIQKKGIELGNPRQRRWIAAEFISMAIWIPVALFVLDLPLLKYHVVAMLIGQCLTAFFAVWTVHHDCDRDHFIARTLRNPIKSFIAFDMFYHVEHHLYPKVPTCKLAKLSKRLDEAAPELSKMQVY